MKPADFTVKQWVAYVPTHAEGDLDHADVEIGLVSSVNEQVVFVKYKPQLMKFGWEGATSQATDPNDLIALPDGTPTPLPISWIDTLRCGCQACLARSLLYQHCLETAEPLYVLDCRMFGVGWIVDDVHAAHDKPSESPRYATLWAAVSAVLATQTHCDAYVSSWPLKPDGHADFLWECESVERISSAKEA